MSGAWSLDIRTALVAVAMLLALEAAAFLLHRRWQDRSIGYRVQMMRAHLTVLDGGRARLTIAYDLRTYRSGIVSVLLPDLPPGAVVDEESATFDGSPAEIDHSRDSRRRALLRSEARRRSPRSLTVAFDIAGNPYLVERAWVTGVHAKTARAEFSLQSPSDRSPVVVRCIVDDGLRRSSNWQVLPVIEGHYVAVIKELRPGASVRLLWVEKYEPPE